MLWFFEGSKSFGRLNIDDLVGRRAGSFLLYFSLFFEEIKLFWFEKLSSTSTVSTLTVILLYVIAIRLDNRLNLLTSLHKFQFFHVISFHFSQRIEINRLSPRF